MDDSASPAPADSGLSFGGPDEGVTRGHYDPTDLTHALRRAWYLIERGLDQGPRLEGLQSHQLWVLAALQHSKRRMSDLAAVTRTSQANISGMVSRLEERGLVLRGHSGADRRVVEVELTEEGRLAIRDSRRALASRADSVMRHLSDAERETLAGLLRRAVQPEE